MKETRTLVSYRNVLVAKPCSPEDALKSGAILPVPPPEIPTRRSNMNRARMATIASTWLLLWTAAAAQEQISIRCVTKEPDENERGRIDQAMRNFRDLRQAAGL